MSSASETSLAGRLRRRCADAWRRGTIGAGAFWTALALILFYNFPYFRSLQHANELPRVFLTMAIVEEGRFEIDTYRQLYGYRKAMDLSRAHCLTPRAAHALRRALGLRRTHHHPPRCRESYYPNKAPGMSLLGVPFYAALRLAWRVGGAEPDVRRVRDPTERLERLRTATWWLRLGTAALPTFLFLILLYVWLRGFVPAAFPRRVAVAAYGLGTLVFTYSVQLMSHHLATALMFSAFIAVHHVARRGGRPWLLALAGLAGGASLATDYQMLFVGVPLTLYALWVLRDRLVYAPLAILGAIPPLALLLYYHHDCFGAIDWTGYRFLVDRRDQGLHDQGLLGITTPKAEAFSSSFFSASNGLFYFSPWLLVGLGALPLLHWHRAGPTGPTDPTSGGGAPRGAGWWSRVAPRLPPAELALSVVVIGFFSYFITSVAFWRGGWQTGPRYVCAMLPFFVLPFALALHRLRRWPLLRGVILAPALVGILAYALIVTTFPHFPETYRYPLFDLVGVLLHEGYVSYNLGWLLGLDGQASLVPYALALAGLGLYFTVGTVEWRALVRPGAARPLARHRSRWRLAGGVLALALAGIWWASYHHDAQLGFRKSVRAAHARREARRRGWRPPRGAKPAVDYPAFLRRSRGWIRQHWEPRHAGLKPGPAPRPRDRRR